MHTTDYVTGPVRPCCGQRHWGPQCPDGLVMCCICFERVTLDELHQTCTGELEDVCLRCARQEEREEKR